MKMRLEAKLIYKDTDSAKIGVRIDHNGVKEELIPEIYLAMLKGMRDAHTREFYHAMAEFSMYDTDDMLDFFMGGGDNDDR